MKLLDNLHPSLIDLHLSGSNKEQVLSRLVALFVEAKVIVQGEALLESLLEREGLGSTGIGHGVAIPHGRSAELTRPAIAFARTEQEVDFDSIDGQPTRLFFLLVAPENAGNDHLHLLAKIARLMRDATVRERLLQLEQADDVFALFDSRESV